MKLVHLQHKFNIPHERIEKAQKFLKNFDDNNPTYVFVENDILHCSTILELELSKSKFDSSKKEKVIVNLVCSFKEREEIYVNTEKPLLNHPIIQPSGLMMQNGLWKFESFENLKNELKTILEIPEDYIEKRKEAMELIDNYLENKIDKFQYETNIKKYNTYNKFLDKEIKEKYSQSSKEKRRQQLNRLLTLMNDMVAKDEMTKEERDYFYKTLSVEN